MWMHIEIKLHRKGEKLYEHSKQEVQKSLDKYLSPDGILQAEEIEKDWFPSCKANVFCLIHIQMKNCNSNCRIFK